jgi:hypothetical protein
VESRISPRNYLSSVKVSPWKSDGSLWKPWEGTDSGCVCASTSCIGISSHPPHLVQIALPSLPVTSAALVLYFLRSYTHATGTIFFLDKVSTGDAVVIKHFLKKVSNTVGTYLVRSTSTTDTQYSTLYEPPVDWTGNMEPHSKLESSGRDKKSFATIISRDQCFLYQLR